MAHKISNPKFIQKKSKGHQISQIDDNRFKVLSSSGNTYTVSINGNSGFCNCKWSQYRPAHDRRSACSHVVATLNFIKEQENKRVSVWTNEDDAKRQKKQRMAIGDGVILTVRGVK